MTYGEARTREDDNVSDNPWNVGPAPQTPPNGASRPAPVTRPVPGPTAPPSPRIAGEVTWSTAAPSVTAPPAQVQTPQAVTQQMYLPPVAPPGSAAAAAADRAATEIPPEVPARWGWRAFVAFVGGGIIAASGFAAAQEFGGDDPVTVAVATTVEPTVTSTPSIVVEPPEIDASEPVAFVAQVLGPAIVQVEIPNVGLGSGVVFADGLVMTNHHVTGGETDVEIRTADGRVLPGEVLGSDARTDIAVVSVGEGSGLPIAELATGIELQVGQTTVAIGSPFQLQQTVTSGIISALDRPVFNGVGYNPMIQTDAAINQGNSGGALADRNGRVIGINTAIQTDGLSTGNLGVGFAVPIDTAKGIADRILAGQPIEAGFLGVSGGPTEDGSPGVLVDGLTAHSAAEIAGIRVGDRIVAIDDAPVTLIEELAGLVQTKFPGDAVEIELFREGEKLTVTAVLGQR